MVIWCVCFVGNLTELVVINDQVIHTSSYLRYYYDVNRDYIEEMGEINGVESSLMLLDQYESGRESPPLPPPTIYW